MKVVRKGSGTTSEKPHLVGAPGSGQTRDTGTHRDFPSFFVGELQPVSLFVNGVSARRCLCIYGAAALRLPSDSVQWAHTEQAATDGTFSVTHTCRRSVLGLSYCAEVLALLF